MNTLLVIRSTRLDSWRQKLYGITSAAAERDWRVQVIDSRPSPRELAELIRFWHPIGIIAECSCANISPRLIDAANQLVGSITPSVYLDFDPSKLRQPLSHSPICVRHDPVAIAELAARELISRNLSSLAFVGWFHRVCWSENKLSAFSRLAKLHGLPLHVFYPTAADEKHPASFQRRLCQWLKSLSLPSGVFAVNDAIAENVIAAASAAGITIPTDLAVIGVDNDIGLCERVSPSLTSIQPGFYESGRRAVELLPIDPAPSPSPNPIFVPPLEIVRRQSTRYKECSDHEVDAALELIRRKATSGLRARDVIAKCFTCSRRSAEYRFLAATGSSILTEILRIRLLAVERLRSEENITGKEAATRCGWRSYDAYSKVRNSPIYTKPSNPS